MAECTGAGTGAVVFLQNGESVHPPAYFLCLLVFTFEGVVTDRSWRARVCWGREWQSVLVLAQHLSNTCRMVSASSGACSIAC